MKTMENKEKEIVQGTFKKNEKINAITHVHTRDGVDIPISCGIHICEGYREDILFYDKDGVLDTTILAIDFYLLYKRIEIIWSWVVEEGNPSFNTATFHLIEDGTYYTSNVDGKTLILANIAAETESWSVIVKSDDELHFMKIHKIIGIK